MLSYTACTRSSPLFVCAQLGRRDLAALLVCSVGGVDPGHFLSVETPTTDDLSRSASMRNANSTVGPDRSSRSFRGSLSEAMEGFKSTSSGPSRRHRGVVSSPTPSLQYPFPPPPSDHLIHACICAHHSPGPLVHVCVLPDDGVCEPVDTDPDALSKFIDLRTRNGSSALCVASECGHSDVRFLNSDFFLSVGWLAQ